MKRILLSIFGDLKKEYPDFNVFGKECIFSLDKSRYVKLSFVNSFTDTHTIQDCLDCCKVEVLGRRTGERDYIHILLADVLGVEYEPGFSLDKEKPPVPRLKDKDMFFVDDICRWVLRSKYTPEDNKKIYDAVYECVKILQGNDGPVFSNGVVYLPCSVGDRVWIKGGLSFEIERVEILKDTKVFRCGNSGTDDYMSFFEEEIGKFVFLSEEDYKKSLGG